MRKKWKSRGKEWGEVEEWETVNTSAFEQEQGDPDADVHVGLVAQSCLTLCNSMDCRQTPLSMGFPRQEYWSGLLCPPSERLPNPLIEPRPPALQADSLPSEPPRKPKNTGADSPSIIQGNFLTQESNWGLLHCRRILYQLSHGSIAAVVTSPLIWGELVAPWDKLGWTDREFKVVRGRQWPLTILIQKACLWNLVDLPPLWLQCKLHHFPLTSCEFPCHYFIPECLGCCQ